MYCALSAQTLIQDAKRTPLLTVASFKKAFICSWSCYFNNTSETVIRTLEYFHKSWWYCWLIMSLFGVLITCKQWNLPPSMDHQFAILSCKSVLCTQHIFIQQQHCSLGLNPIRLREVAFESIIFMKISLKSNNVIFQHIWRRVFCWVLINISPNSFTSQKKCTTEKALTLLSGIVCMSGLFRTGFSLTELWKIQVMVSKCVGVEFLKMLISSNYFKAC